MKKEIKCYEFYTTYKKLNTIRQFFQNAGFTIYHVSGSSCNYLKIQMFK